MSFLKIGDRAAGAIKSGGTTRRAAKMVVVDADHPDIEDYIDWKVKEEQKVASPRHRLQDRHEKHLNAIMKACVNCEGDNDACFDPKQEPSAEARSSAAKKAICARELHQARASSSRAGLHRDRVPHLRHRLGFGGLSHGLGPELQQLGPRHRRLPAAVEDDGDWDLINRKDGKVAKTSRPAICGKRSAMPPGPPPIRASSSTPP
jgi:ribonucleoside-diphosphate reductase alpha chain